LSLYHDGLCPGDIGLKKGKLILERRYDQLFIIHWTLYSFLVHQQHF